MSQSNLKKVVSKLRYQVGPRRKMSNPLGPEGRLLKIRKTVSALIKHERIELNYPAGDESRGYAERLISEAIRHGDRHKETMEMATYWLTEKQLVHKLFKVLVPRYQDSTLSYTKMWKAPRPTVGRGSEKCVLELRGNVYPPLVPNMFSNVKLLHNVLLDEARTEYELEKRNLERKAYVKQQKMLNAVGADVDDFEDELSGDELTDDDDDDDDLSSDESSDSDKSEKKESPAPSNKASGPADEKEKVT